MSDSGHDEGIPDALIEQAELAHEALQRLLSGTLEVYSHDPAKIPAGQLKLEWSSEMTADQLLQQALHRVQIAEEAREIFQPGKLFCYNCSTATCEHGVPPSPTHVFGGYANSGWPRWEELHNELVSLGDDRVAQLFEAPPSLLARVTGRKRLIADQTAAYGRHSMTYRIIGQLVGGYVAVRSERHALTVQIVETADRVLHLQTLMHDRLREALADATPRTHAALYRLNDAIRKTRNSVTQATSAWQTCHSRAERKQQQELLFGYLRHLSNSVEQKGRQSRRRTHHAEERSQQQRPVHKAADDVAAAQPGDFFRDTVRESNVVVGKAGRCHVFDDRGKHITSLQLTGDKIDRRRRTKRYIQLASGEVEELRPRVLDGVHNLEGE